MSKEKTTAIYFKVSEKERDLIEEGMKIAGISNMSAYLRKMGINGYIINLDVKTLDELLRLMRIMSNNVNQIAYKANSTGNIYEADIKDLQIQFDDIKLGIGDVLRELSALKT